MNVKNFITALLGLVETANAFFPHLPPGLCVGIAAVGRAILAQFFPNTDGK